MTWFDLKLPWPIISDFRDFGGESVYARGKLVFSQLMDLFRGTVSRRASVATTAITRSKRFPAANICG